MADIPVSMPLRMRLYWLQSKRSGKGLQFHHSYTKDFQLCFLSRDGDVIYYSLFSVVHDRFLRDDYLKNIVLSYAQIVLLQQ